MSVFEPGWLLKVFRQNRLESRNLAKLRGHLEDEYQSRISAEACADGMQQVARGFEQERDALRVALKEIIALEDRGVGVTLANDKLRQAQAIAQGALAASEQ